MQFPDHILSAEQFLDTHLLHSFFKSVKIYKSNTLKGKTPLVLKNKIIATLFYEPSTRTRLSFETAMLRLGGQVISTENASQFSSAIKGESLEDSIKVISRYVDAIVLRHPDIGAAQRASLVSSVPIINAGDGAGEHPTQALLDLYTMWEKRGTLDDIAIMFIGDLRYGRTIHSLIPLLSQYHPDVTCISPPSLRLTKEYREYLLTRLGSLAHFSEGSHIMGSDLKRVDVMYVTRVQKERFTNISKYEAVKDVYSITPEIIGQMKKTAMIMHPLPRVNEIGPDVDLDPRAMYFQQAENGVYVRMALLAKLLG